MILLVLKDKAAHHISSSSAIDLQLENTLYFLLFFTLYFDTHKIYEILAVVKGIYY